MINVVKIISHILNMRNFLKIEDSNNLRSKLLL